MTIGRSWSGFILTAALSGLLAWFTTATASAADLYLRVVDVGNGLCVVGKTPDGATLLYDAGFGGDLCAKAVTEIVGAAPIDIVVFSHSDLDHINDGVQILQRGAKLVLHPGDTRQGPVLKALRERLTDLKAQGTQVLSMADTAPPAFGTRYPLGAANLTLVAGWSDGATTQQTGDPALPAPDRRNALSVVVRLDYAGRSVLLTGDTIGRRREEPNTACRNAERLMASGQVSVDSDVLIGQHHGGDNATSNCFIRAVTPTWVVFSAGRGHGHPKQAVADRLVANGVDKDRILRTDRGDDEGEKEHEWVYGGLRGCHDIAGDDDVEIFLSSDGSEPRVQYHNSQTGCPRRPPP